MARALCLALSWASILAPRTHVSVFIRMVRSGCSTDESRSLTQPVAGRVEILQNDQGNRITPSVVAFTPEGRVIGDAAKNQVTGS
jgi:hypothetical protein